MLQCDDNFLVPVLSNYCKLLIKQLNLGADATIFNVQYCSFHCLQYVDSQSKHGPR